MNVVIVNCFDTYESRVDMLYRFFTGKGDKAEVYTSAFRHFQKCPRTEDGKGYHLVKTRSYRKNLSAERILSHVLFARAVRRIVEKKIAEIDLLWVMLPPNSLAMQFARLKKRYPKVKLVYDIIDIWPETMPFHGLEKLPPIQYWKRLRNRYLPCADLVVTECELFQQKIAEGDPENKLSAVNMETLYFAKQSAAGNTAGDYQLSDTELALCYLGSINHIIDISSIADIMKRLAAYRKVTLHIIGDGEKREELTAAVTAAGAQVHYHGVIYDTVQKQEIFDRCHFGLNIMKGSVCVGLTMKSMDYFEAGLPMINNIKGDTWVILEQEGFGLNEPFTLEQLKEFCQRKGMREEIKAYYRNHFSEEAFGNRLQSILAQYRL